MPEGQVAPARESTVLEDGLAAVEAHITRAHIIVDRVLPREDKPPIGSATGILATTSQINSGLSDLCERLEAVASKVGLL